LLSSQVDAITFSDRSPGLVSASSSSIPAIRRLPGRRTSREFDALTRPGDLSLKVMASTWLLNNSALYRLIRIKWASAIEIGSAESGQKRGSRLDFGGLTPAEQTQYRAAPKQFDNYLHTSRQIHRVAAVDGNSDLVRVATPTRRDAKTIDEHRKGVARLLVEG